MLSIIIFIFIAWIVISIISTIHRDIKKNNQSKKELLLLNDAWLLTTEPCQFKHFYNGTGIALDTTNKVIYLKENKLEKSYPFSDIREWKYNISTGGEVSGAIGVQNALNQAGHNARNRQRKLAESGFFVIVRDIDQPQWQIKFLLNSKTETELLKWMEIFRQYVNNE